MCATLCKHKRCSPKWGVASLLLPPEPAHISSLPATIPNLSQPILLKAFTLNLATKNGEGGFGKGLCRKKEEKLYKKNTQKTTVKKYRNKYKLKKEKIQKRNGLMVIYCVAYIHSSCTCTACRGNIQRGRGNNKEKREKKVSHNCRLKYHLDTFQYFGDFFQTS